MEKPKPTISRTTEAIEKMRQAFGGNIEELKDIENLFSLIQTKNSGSGLISLELSKFLETKSLKELLEEGLRVFTVKLNLLTEELERKNTYILVREILPRVYRLKILIRRLLDLTELVIAMTAREEEKPQNKDVDFKEIQELKISAEEAVSRARAALVPPRKTPTEPKPTPTPKPEVAPAPEPVTIEHLEPEAESVAEYNPNDNLELFSFLRKETREILLAWGGREAADLFEKFAEETRNPEKVTFHKLSQEEQEEIAKLILKVAKIDSSITENVDSVIKDINTEIEIRKKQYLENKKLEEPAILASVITPEIAPTESETEPAKSEMESINPLDQIVVSSIISYRGKNYEVKELPSEQNRNRYMLTSPGEPVFRANENQLKKVLESGEAALIPLEAKEEYLQVSTLEAPPAPGTESEPESVNPLDQIIVGSVISFQGKNYKITKLLPGKEYGKEYELELIDEPNAPPGITDENWLRELLERGEITIVMPEVLPRPAVEPLPDTEVAKEWTEEDQRELEELEELERRSSK